MSVDKYFEWNEYSGEGIPSIFLYKDQPITFNFYEEDKTIYPYRIEWRCGGFSLITDSSGTYIRVYGVQIIHEEWYYPLPEVRSIVYEDVTFTFTPIPFPIPKQN